jgi:hypothetical protein
MNFIHPKEVIWRFVLLPVGLTVLSWSESTKTKVSVGLCGACRGEALREDGSVTNKKVCARLRTSAVN